VVRTKHSDTLLLEEKGSAPILKMALENPVASIRNLIKNSLYKFMQFFWECYSNDKFDPSWYIEYQCNELEILARRVAKGEPKEYDLVFNQPPGTTKTATVSIFFPVWSWVNWYWMKFITSSHSAPLSLESAEYSRDIIRSDKFKAYFPEISIKQDKDSKSNFRVVKNIFLNAGQAPRLLQGGGRVSTSVDARIMGFHAHIIIPDDIIDPKRALSDAGILTANNHLDHLGTRKTDKKVSAMVMIMQRLSQLDPTGHLLDKPDKKIRHICLPGEIHNYKEFVKPPELVQFYINGLLDPKRLDESALKELEADLGQYGYAGQIGQNPAPPGGGMFKVDHFQMLSVNLNPVNYLQTVRYWDKAGTKDGGAYTTGVKISKLANNKCVIEDVKRGQWASEERERIIKETAESDGREVIVMIEQEPGSGGKESAENTIRNLAGFVCLRDLPKGNKEFRADPLSVQVNNGNILLRVADWNYKFIEEFRLFPNGKYKDQVDASSASFNYMMHKKVARRIT